MTSLVTYLFVVVIFFPPTAQARVPESKTFSFFIEGRFQSPIEDYTISSVDVDNQSNFPFALCLVGPDPEIGSTYTYMTLGIRLGNRLVWEANRGNPVHSNSTLVFGQDGNLVLAEGNGDVVWQTNTGNKGVVDLKLLKNGNLVMLDRKGGFVWQSFDYPTDTILVGQSLLSGEQHKLVSRISPHDNRNGPYSLALYGKRPVFYYKGKHSETPEIYSEMESLFVEFEDLAKITLQSDQATDDPIFFALMFNFTFVDSTSMGVSPNQQKINTTYSFMQLGGDGNLRFYTYSDKVRDLVNRIPWDVTFTLFSREDSRESECQLPERCGRFGVCENNQCVACPTPNGLMGWSDRCAPPTLPPCNGGKNVRYYKIDGVEHFSSNFSGEGPMKLGQCRDKCSQDCKCVGFFYKQLSSTCLLTPQLNTLTKVSNATHVAFIKVAK